MTRHPLRIALIAMGVAGLVSSAGHAQKITRQERKQSEKLFSGKLYLRLDAPCEKGRQPFGIYLAPLVEVSPTGANTEAGNGVSFGWFNAGSTSWSARVNDQMELDELDWDEDEASVEIELEGAGSAEGHDTVIRFVQIHSFADFQAAFDKTFSRIPLQEEHPEWSAEIRQAIGQRRLLQGMNKRQAFYVVGMPARVSKETKDGKEIEIWTLQRQGLEIGFFTMKTGDPGAAPETIRFENGVLASADVANGTGTQLDLDH